MEQRGFLARAAERSRAEEFAQLRVAGSQRLPVRVAEGKCFSFVDRVLYFIDARQNQKLMAVLAHLTQNIFQEKIFTGEESWLDSSLDIGFSGLLRTGMESAGKLPQWVNQLLMRPCCTTSWRMTSYLLSQNGKCV